MSDRLASLLTPEILRELDLIWPERCPSPSSTHQQFIIAAAQREVIDRMHAMYDRANADQKVLP